MGEKGEPMFRLSKGYAGVFLVGGAEEPEQIKQALLQLEPRLAVWRVYRHQRGTSQSDENISYLDGVSLQEGDKILPPFDGTGYRLTIKRYEDGFVTQKSAIRGLIMESEYQKGCGLIPSLSPDAPNEGGFFVILEKWINRKMN